jgi:thiol-disulfide isomerase/thioredoxin
MGQTASAVSYYLRAAERTSDELIQYECLLRSALCFEKQGCRNFTVKGLLLHALSILPKRPEAYYLLSRFYEKENKDGSWQECYTIASIGNSVADLNSAPLTTDVGYSGNYVLLFQKAVSSWWCGLCKESNNIFKELLAKYDMKEEFKNSVINNLNFFESKNKLKN